MAGAGTGEFDYIVVGGGAAGCVLAARLSEDPAKRVLLVESGRRDTDMFIHIPATFFKVLDKGRDAIFYKSEGEPGLNGRPSIVPQGHVIGGGSSINAMVYIRGSRRDYDTWAQMGCRNWSYEKVLPVFRDLESNQRLAGEYHGTSGELSVSEVAPDFGTGGVVGGGLLRMAWNGAEDDEDETQD